MELNLDPLLKACSVERMNPKKDIQWFHVVICFVHVVIQEINRGQSLILFQVECINSSMGIQHIWIVQLWVSPYQLFDLEDEVMLKFRHVQHRMWSMRWHVHVVIMIMSIQQQKHWLKLWLVSITCIISNHILIYIIDHRYRANRIIHEKLTGISLYPGIPHEPSEQE